MTKIKKSPKNFITCEQGIYTPTLESCRPDLNSTVSTLAICYCDAWLARPRVNRNTRLIKVKQLQFNMCHPISLFLPILIYQDLFILLIFIYNKKIIIRCELHIYLKINPYVSQKQNTYSE